jgi:acetyl-CoA carboxylase carboxyl transferase subunit beta
MNIPNNNSAAPVQPTAGNAGANVTKGDNAASLWQKCRSCEQIVYQSQLDENFNVCPQCGFLFPLNARKRIEMLTDVGSFHETNANLRSLDILNFAGDHSYEKKLAETIQNTGLPEAVITGHATLEGMPFSLAVMDFRFMGASMGSAVGEKITRQIEYATANRQPILLVTASGGARMQEGALSLMQMAKTSGALMRHDEAGLLCIVLLTHPTTGGVTASFASLGDIILAEPKALIGFAGPRVIEQTTKARLPEGFQTAEFLLQHGFIDSIVHRQQQRSSLAFFLRCAAKQKC